MDNPTEHQLRSYFAGMLDHRGVFNVVQRGRVKKLIIAIKTRSAKQAVAFQKWAGGDICLFKSNIPTAKSTHSTYVIRYYNLKAAKIIESLGSFIVAQRARLFEACTFRGLPIPELLEPDMNFYIGGAIDAKESFENKPFRGKPYASFRFTTYSPKEAECLGLKQYINLGRPYCQCRYQMSKDLLERVKPYILEYDKYRACLYEGIATQVDFSILSVKIPQKTTNRNPQEQLRDRLRHRLRELVGSRSERYHELIGCPSAQLTKHIESQFEPWMSWENSDQWDIDHVIPCRAFDLSVKEQRLKCFHYTNLRPLSKTENSSKQDRLPDGRLARRI